MPLRALPRALVLLALALPRPAAAEDVVVFAAASLRTALDAVAADFEAATGQEVTVSYGGSNQLAQQILQGAPADIFLSASVDWMDAVEAGGLAVAGTRADLLGNRLVLVAHDPGAAPIAIGPGLDLPALLGEGRLAMAMVDAVPAGQYGRAALESLGLWAGVADHLAQTENVRAALALVATGEAPLGIVYATDAVASPRVRVVATFPAESHSPITYPFALTRRGAANPAARALLDFVRGPDAAATWRRFGFTPAP